MISLIAWTVINVLFVTVYAAPFEMQNAIKPNIQMYSSSSNIVDTGKCGDDLIWTLYDDGLLNITGTGDMYNYESYSIFYWRKNRIKSVCLENGITSIGAYAFAYMDDLTCNIEIPNSVIKIEDHAFYGCGLTGKLDIPESVKMIGDYAFGYCTGLTGNIIIPSGITSIGNWSFANCYGLSGNLIIPDNITTIGDYAFAYCKGLTGKLIMSSEVVSIGKSAFENCRFTGRLVIPQNVKTIGEEAFMHCINLQDNIIIPENVVFIGKNAFFNCKGITDVNIAKKKDSISGSPWGLITNNQAVIHWANQSDTAYKINIISPGDVEYNAAGKTTPDVVITDTER